MRLSTQSGLRALTKKKTDTTNTSNTTSTVSTEFTEVQFDVYSQGNRDRGLAFKFTSEDNSHKLQFKASNFKESKKTKVTKRLKKNTKYKVVAVGSYKGKGVEQGLAGSFGRKTQRIK